MSIITNKKINKRHGLASTGFYQSYMDMMRRCYNVKSPRYKNYGARGIKVCDRWHDFYNFIEDMYDSWINGLTIDRLDCEIDYNKDNCRWLEKKYQSLNRTNSIKKNNIRVAPIARENKIKAGVFGGRIRRGWSIDKIIKTPVLARGNPVSFKYLEYSLSYKDLVKITKLGYHNIYKRLHKENWSVEQLFKHYNIIFTGVINE